MTTRNRQPQFNLAVNDALHMFVIRNSVLFTNQYKKFYFISSGLFENFLIQDFVTKQCNYTYYLIII